MAPNSMRAVVRHLLSCVQLVRALLAPRRALVVTPTSRAELLEHWCARAVMLD